MENRSSIGATLDRGKRAMPPGEVDRPSRPGNGDGPMQATAVAGEIRLYRVIKGRDRGNQQCEQTDNADDAGKSKAFPWQASSPRPMASARCYSGRVASPVRVGHCALFMVLLDEEPV